VNPQWHDEFVALCALFPSGELTEEEWALLQVHLAYCDSCRMVFDQYQQVASEVIPVMAASAVLEPAAESAESTFSMEAAENRLMSRLNSDSQTSRTPKPQSMRWKLPATLIAACATVISGLIGLSLHHSGIRPAVQSAPTSNVAERTRLEENPGANSELKSQLEVARHEVTELQQQISSTKDLYRQSTSTATNMEQQLEAEKNQRIKMSDERDTLSQGLAAAQTELQSLRSRSTTFDVASSQQAAQAENLKAKLHEANLALEEKDRMLALDKEFLAHDREIRDLIGARDLYIADIYDVAQTGKTSKPFGRLFYTKDKSLVFYGYDLDKQAGLKQSVAFQAWGSGDDKQDVSLGIFYQDDTHKRWVLRFNDTKTLAHLNKVFVTAEPQGGSAKPTGKPLLLAYLQIQPNHP
jgi:myosin heavy subunit